jgi:phage shock protein PspC (stress-responsive transcriptional regulator)
LKAGSEVTGNVAEDRGGGPPGSLRGINCAVIIGRANEMPEGTLVRSRNDRMIAGVCGGIARWLGWDSTAVRILFVLATIFSFGLGGILAYVILGIIMPAEEITPHE